MKLIEIDDYFNRIRDELDNIADDGKIELAEMIQETLRKHIPKRTGNAAASVDFDIFQNGGEVGSRLLYLTYVLRGTNPSPGRFIPGLGGDSNGGKRLTGRAPRDISSGVDLIRSSYEQLGIHPGIQPNPFLDRAMEEVMEHVDDMLRKWSNEFGR